MAEHDKIPPMGLHPRLVKKLLDSLESDDSFRATFQRSPEEALRSLGYTDPWACLALKEGATLASPDRIKAQRTKLEDSLVSVQQYLCPVTE
jgi:putative modified peptide